MSGYRKTVPLHDLSTYARPRAVRHPDADYSGDIDIHVTICAAAGKPFLDRDIAAMVCENVEIYCRTRDYRLYGYSLMPDHLHVLLSPASSNTPLSRWLHSFKSYTTHVFRDQTGAAVLWQRSAHDHICRDGESAEVVMRYIAENPVRAGLVDDWRDWPWTRVFVRM